MITRLEERGCKKADRYWPIMNEKFEFVNGIRVEQQKPEQLCDTDLTKRVFEVSRHGTYISIYLGRWEVNDRNIRFCDDCPPAALCSLA